MIWIPIFLTTCLGVVALVMYVDYLDAVWEAERWWYGPDSMRETPDE